MKWLMGVLLLVMTAAVIAATLSPSAQEVTPDEALLGLFPEDSHSMIFVDVGELRSSELVGAYLEQLKVHFQDAAADFSRRTGLDPLKDVNQVMLGWMGDDEFLGGFSADYDAQDLEEYFEERNTISEVYEGRTIYQPDSESNLSLAFVNGLVLMGERALVRGAIGRMGTSAPTALDNPKLLTSIRSIEPGNQVWGVGSLPERLIPDALAPPMAIDLLAALEKVTYQMRLDSAVTARALGQFTSSEAAERTGELLRGLLALGKMQMMGSEALVQLLDGFQISSIDSAIEIYFSADSELLESAAEQGWAIPRIADE